MSNAKKQITLWLSAVSVLFLITLISSRQGYFVGSLIILTIVSAALASSWNIVGGMAG